MPLDNLPNDECESYVYDGVTSSDNFSIIPSYYANDFGNKILQFYLVILIIL